MPQAHIGLNMISQTDNAELYFSTKFGTKEDPGYYLATNDKTLIEFGQLGMVRSIKKKVGRKIYSILQRDGQGSFTINLDMATAAGYDSSTGIQNLAANLINQAYENIGALPEDTWNTIEKKFRNFDANRVIARFKDFRKLVSAKDIIPDFDEHQVPIVTVMDGCANICTYCPIGGHVELYSLDKINSNLELAREVLETYHKNSITELREGFINASDILWFKTLKNKSNGVDPLDIIARYKEIFPDVEKLGTFFGTDNLNRVSESYLRKLVYNAKAKNSSDTYFGAGITRGYVGIETGSTQGSRILKKFQTKEEKIRGVQKLRKAGIGTKLIVQVGVFGEGFYPTKEDIGKKSKFIPTRQALDETIDLIIQTAPYRIMISEHQPLKGIGMNRLIETGQIVSYQNKESVKNEIDYLVQKLTREHKLGNIKWQGMDRLNPDYEPPIEYEYEDFVKGREGQGNKKEKKFKLVS